MTNNSPSIDDDYSSLLAIFNLFKHSEEQHDGTGCYDCEVQNEIADLLNNKRDRYFWPDSYNPTDQPTVVSDATEGASK